MRVTTWAASMNVTPTAPSRVLTQRRYITHLAVTATVTGWSGFTFTPRVFIVNFPLLVFMKAGVFFSTLGIIKQIKSNSDTPQRHFQALQE